MRMAQLRPQHAAVARMSRTDLDRAEGAHTRRTALGAKGRVQEQLQKCGTPALLCRLAHERLACSIVQRRRQEVRGEKKNTEVMLG